MKNAKKLLTGVCALLFTFSLTGGVAALTADAQATLNARTQSFVIENGASIRTGVPYGIRYTASISQSEYETLQSSYSSVEYGVLICPTDLLAGKTLDFDYTDGLVPENADEGQVEFGYVAVTPVLDEAVGRYVMKGSLVSIEEENLSRPFTGKAYIKTTDSTGVVKYVYTEEVSRAIYTVATYALNSVDQEFTATLDEKEDGATQTPREYLNEIINKVQSVYGEPEITVVSTNAETKAYNILNGGDEFTVTATVKKTVGGVTRTLEACPTVVLDETAGEAGVELTKIGTNTYRVKGYDTDGYNFKATIGTGNNKLETAVFEKPVKSWENTVETTDIVPQWAGADQAVLTSVSEGDFAGAYRWTNGSRLCISSAVTDQLAVGDRIMLEVWAKDGMYPLVQYLGSGDQYLTSSSGTVADCFSYRVLDRNGNVITGNPVEHKGEWLTFEYTALKAKEAVATTQFNFMAFYESKYSEILGEGAELYVRNMRALKYGSGATVALPEGLIDENKTYEFLSQIDVSKLDLTDERGVTKSVSATAIGGYVENGILYTGLGEQTITLTAAGYSDGVQVTVKGADTGVILDGADNSNIVKGTNFDMSYQTEERNLKENAWLLDNAGKDGEGDIYGGYMEKSDGFGFTDKVSAQMKQGYSVYVEVFATKDTVLIANAGGDKFLYYKEDNDCVKYYDASGNERIFTTGTGILANAGQLVGQWITVEINLTADWNATENYISLYTGQFDKANEFYLGKIWLAKGRVDTNSDDNGITIPAMTFIQERALLNSSYITTGEKASLTQATEEGLTDAYKYGYDLEAVAEASAIVFTKAARESFMKNGSYLYITVYNVDMNFIAEMCGTALFLYSAPSATNYESKGISWQAYVHGEDGSLTKATSGDQLKNAWVTYEFTFDATGETNAFNHLAQFRPLSTGSETTLYIRDLRYSAAQLAAFAAVNA